MTKEHLRFILIFDQKTNIKGTQTQTKISMDLSICQAKDGFSLDELVMKLAEVFEQKALAELLKMIL